jgi:hypothetical protein
MFQVYFHIPSKSSYRQVEDAQVLGDVKEVESLLSELTSSDDHIFIYESEKKLKLSIFYEDENVFGFEIISSSGILYRNFKREELICSLNVINQLIESPKTFQFVEETI